LGPIDSPTPVPSDPVLNNWPDNDQRYDPIPPTEGSVQLIPSELGFYFATPEDYTNTPKIIRLVNLTQREIKYLSYNLMAVQGPYVETGDNFQLVDVPEPTILLPSQSLEFKVTFTASLNECMAVLYVHTNEFPPLVTWLSGHVFLGIIE
jgi:hypothetical protein